MRSRVALAYRFAATVTADGGTRLEFELRHLQHAVALAEHGHFGRAAEALEMSQPALSRSIQVLESRVGARLFDRLGRGVVPTPVGEALIERARSVLAGVRGLEDELGALLGIDTGLLRVAVGPYVAAVLLGPILARVTTRHPGLQIEVSEVSAPRMRAILEAGEVEVLIGEQALFDDDAAYTVESMRVRHGEYICRAGHPLLERSEIRLSDILHYPLATTYILPRVWERLAPSAGAAELAGRAWKVRCQSLVAIASLVAQSDCVGLFSRGMIGRELEEGSLAVIPFEGTKPSARWAIVYPRDRTLSPAALAFIEATREADVAVD